MENTDKTPKTVEVAEEPKAPEAAKPDTITREQAKEKGWSPAEIDSAEKRGMVAALAVNNDASQAAKDAADKKKAADALAEANNGKRAEDKLPGNFLDDMDKELNPAQEKLFLELFPPGTKPRAFYFRAKNERLARQRAESERDKLALELQLRKDDDVRREKPATEPEVDEDGNPIDPDDKPLTRKELLKMRQDEQAAIDKQQKELNERSERVGNALVAQEEFAKSVYPDFAETVALATELVNKVNMIADPITRGKVVRLVKDLQKTAAEADKHDVDGYTASMIAYELGQLHPEYGQKKPANNGHDKDKQVPKADGEPKLTPEQMERIKENTQRRASSASLPGDGGGRRVISVSDVKVKDLLRMSPEERFKFKKDHPAKFSELMRG